MYHQIARPPKFSGNRGLCVAPGLFRRQMIELRDAGFRATTLDSSAEASGEKTIVITFDDGFQNAVSESTPILAECGFKAIQFLVADRRTNQWDIDIGYPAAPLIDDSQAREWLAAGHEIGAHTLTHPRLTRISVSEARREIFESKSRLEDRLQHPVRHFCYPYGDFDPAIQELVIEAGFETACSTEPGSNLDHPNRYGLRRWLATHRRPALAAWFPGWF